MLTFGCPVSYTKALGMAHFVLVFTNPDVCCWFAITWKNVSNSTFNFTIYNKTFILQLFASFKTDVLTILGLTIIFIGSTFIRNIVSEHGDYLVYNF